MTVDELEPGQVADVHRAVTLLAERAVVVLSGAGLSTDSGIPDYRGPDAPARRPMTYDEFVSGPAAQQRYWARSHVGWRRMAHARPNDGHRAVAHLEDAGVVRSVITQNVDGLHQAAGSLEVVDLHGRLSRVICLRCGDLSSREVLDQRLAALNPGFADDDVRVDAVMAPDGDADVTSVSDFVIAPCLICGGPLKPDVVFFGENVPAGRVRVCYDAVDAAGALLVVGSSLTVQSGLRFVRRAHEHGLPIVLVNRGATRGDPLVTVKVDAGVTPVLQALRRALT
ncbi:MAG TPA: NAD-dependent protein deacetylase [Actinomycetales bacterium]|nr:NAD-dependent protein deacetylase [Actinomycetales bacterium]